MKTIIIAEDEKMLLKSLEFKLKKEGYNVVAVENGKDAIEYLEANHVDGIIADMMMPFKNGLEIISAAKEKSLALPVLILSSVGQEDMVVRAFDLGAKEYLTKPFSPNELIIRLKRMLAGV